MAIPTGPNVWLEKARMLAPLIEQHRDAGEAQRQLAKPVYEAIRQLGLFKLWLPRSLGGEELDFRTVAEAIESIAYMDGSAAWNVVIANQSAWMLGYIDQESAADMLSEDVNVTLGGSGQPNGIATPAEGGYRVTGRWSFVSGGNHTRWLCGVCRIKDGDGFLMNEDGTPVTRFPFFSSDQYEIIDTWHTTGMRATGSHDMRVDDAFVPEGRALDNQATTSAFQSGTLYQTNFRKIFGWPLAFVSLGIAAEAIDAFASLAISKTPSRGTKRLADNEYVQMTLGKAIARLNSGRSYLYQMCDRMWTAMETRQGDDEALLQEALLAGSYAAESAADAVDLLRTASGTSGVYEGNKIERCWRDVHVVTQHANLSPRNYVRNGALRLDLASNRTALGAEAQPDQGLEQPRPRRDR